MKLEKQACMLALAAILLLIVGAFVVGFPAGATLAEETDIDLNAFEGSVILDDPVYFQEATPDEPEVKPTQQPTIEPTQAPGEQPTVEPTHEPTAEPAADAKFTVQITPPTGWRNTASAQACVDIADENGTGFKQVKVSTGGAGWMDVTEQAESGSFDLDVYDNGTLTVRVIDRQDGYHDGTAKIMCFDRTAPTVTAGISGEPLHIEAKDDLSGVAGIQVNGLLFTTLDGGKLDIHFNEVETLKSYEKLVVRAYDCAGNFSEAVTLKNPYYGQATSKPTTVFNGIKYFFRCFAYREERLYGFADEAHADKFINICNRVIIETGHVIYNDRLCASAKFGQSKYLEEFIKSSDSARGDNECICILFHDFFSKTHSFCTYNFSAFTFNRFKLVHEGRNNACYLSTVF